MGLEASYRQALDWSNLSFGDMIDPGQGFIYETQETPRGEILRTVDFGAGLLAFTEKFYLGVAGHHLNEPDESLVLGVSALPMKLTAHAGAKLPLQRSVKGVEAWISPNVFYRRKANSTTECGPLRQQRPLWQVCGTVASSPRTPAMHSSCFWVLKRNHAFWLQLRHHHFTADPRHRRHP